ncbi:MAG: hypothetical protein ACYDDA_09865 [Acidiferrobacteraceae bacterium]
MHEQREEDHEELVYSEYDLHTLPDGRIAGRCCTNDNLDLGCPSEYAEWEITYRNRTDCLRTTGGCHVGFSGHRVTVTLDGERVSALPPPMTRAGAKP